MTLSGKRILVTRSLEQAGELAALVRRAGGIPVLFPTIRLTHPENCDPLDRETSLAVRAERGFLKRLEGGCQVPIAAYGMVNGDTVALSGLIGKPDGSRILRGRRSGSTSDPEATGVALAEDLLAQGGREILDEVYRQSGS